jgi:hypothetical protein
MGLRHFGQIGGGGFLGMTLTLDQARAFRLTVTSGCPGKGGDKRIYGWQIANVCSVGDSCLINFSFARNVGVEFRFSRMEVISRDFHQT